MSESSFQFQSPLFFWLLALLPLVLVWEWRKRHLLKLPFPSRLALGEYRKTLKARFETLPAWLKIAGMALLVTALARPQTVTQDTQIHSEGVDIALILDTSKSMLALDMSLDGAQTDRMTAVKSVVKDFVKGRLHDRIGMVVFGQQAYTQCPLTFDYDVLVGYLDLLDVGIAGDATAIGNALATAVKRLEDSQAKSRVAILLTDGENTAGEVSPKVAMQLAEDKGVKVYTIAVGSRAKRVPFPMETRFGTRIQQVELKVDEELLKQIAEATGGRFFRADSTETLREIYATIDKLEKSEVQIDRFTEYEEHYLSYLIPALALLISGWTLRHTVFLRVP